MLASGFSSTGLLPAAASATRAQERSLDAQIQQVRNQAAPGTAVTVDTQYEVGPDGRLIPVQATVQSSQIDRQAPQDTSLPVGSQALVAQSITQAQSQEQIASRLTPEEQQVINDLRARDLEVRIEEAQHFRAAGGLASGAIDLQFTQGPDGQFYATGGAVSVSTTPTTDPAQAARDAGTLALAATAPATAGAQDFSVARSATSQAAGRFQEAVNQISDRSADPTALPEADENDDGFAPVDVAV